MTHDVLLVGARGFGAVHLMNLDRLADRIRLVAVADPSGGPAEGFGSDVPAFTSLDAALDAGIRPDVVIIATPTGTHFPLAMRALAAGCDVYLEKPPVATMAQFLELLAEQERTGGAVQVGFQSFGSHALADIAALGRPTSVATWAIWTRDAAYWTRSPWAGRRMLDGAPIVDGVVTNPLAHAIATSLRIAGARRIVLLPLRRDCTGPAAPITSRGGLLGRTTWPNRPGSCAANTWKAATATICAPASTRTPRARRPTTIARR